MKKTTYFRFHIFGIIIFNSLINIILEPIVDPTKENPTTLFIIMYTVHIVHNCTLYTVCIIEVLKSLNYKYTT